MQNGGKKFNKNFMKYCKKFNIKFYNQKFFSDDTKKKTMY